MKGGFVFTIHDLSDLSIKDKDSTIAAELTRHNGIFMKGCESDPALPSTGDENGNSQDQLC